MSYYESLKSSGASGGCAFDEVLTDDLSYPWESGTTALCNFYCASMQCTNGLLWRIVKDETDDWLPATRSSSEKSLNDRSYCMVAAPDGRYFRYMRHRNRYWSEACAYRAKRYYYYFDLSAVENGSLVNSTWGSYQYRQCSQSWQSFCGLRCELVIRRTWRLRLTRLMACMCRTFASTFSTIKPTTRGTCSTTRCFWSSPASSLWCRAC